MVISFPNPTSDNAFKCSKSCFQSFCFLIGKPSASHGRPATKQLVLQPIADALTLIVISVSCSPIKKLVVGTISKTALKQYQEDPINCDATAERLQYVSARFTIFVMKSFTTALVFIMLQLDLFLPDRSGGGVQVVVDMGMEIG